MQVKLVSFFFGFPWINHVIESNYEQQISAITTLLLEAAKVRATSDQIR